MSDIFAVILAGVLLPVGLLHLIWASGASWPFRSEAHLAQSVIGTPFEMPRLQKAGLTLAAASAILLAGLLPLAFADLIETGLPERALRWALMVEAAVFLLRGSYGYLPAMARAAPLEPFRTLNRRYYNPLILALGGLCVALLAVA
ncbi:DUF3995 domain-containing protein [Dinoroseobacter sp. S76]|uniref:DUF3995 domain-containing protein n=1 Tax=Dinoroseobacter sp. S76 TaxID=3415124 RepID=UPI003C7BE9D2